MRDSQSGQPKSNPTTTTPLLPGGSEDANKIGANQNEQFFDEQYEKAVVRRSDYFAEAAEMLKVYDSNADNFTAAEFAAKNKKLLARTTAIRLSSEQVQSSAPSIVNPNPLPEQNTQVRSIPGNASRQSATSAKSEESCTIKDCCKLSGLFVAGVVGAGGVGAVVTYVASAVGANALAYCGVKAATVITPIAEASAVGGAILSLPTAGAVALKIACSRSTASSSDPQPLCDGTKCALFTSAAATVGAGVVGAPIGITVASTAVGAAALSIVGPVATKILEMSR